MNSAVTKTLMGALFVSALSNNAIANAQQVISMRSETLNVSGSQTTKLTARQQAIVPIAAYMALGNMSRLETALGAGLDAGLAVSDIKEVLTQLYAYVGFPRSLNALNLLLRVTKARHAAGINDAPGKEPNKLPLPDQMYEVGTANQTKLVGQPVAGELFEFAPAIDQYLKTHLFGDIFARDNLDWQSREVATIGALAVLDGVESQLQSHMNISLNIGLNEGQLRQVASVLNADVGRDAAKRAQDALVRELANR